MATPTGGHDDHEDHEDHDHDHGHEDHEDHGDHEDKEYSDEEIAAAGPSPTASAGCEPHGDHWHCEGPATAVQTPAPEDTPASEETGEAEETDSGNNAGFANIIPLVGAVAAAALAL